MAAKAKNPGVAPGKRRVTTVEETVEEGAPGGELNLETPDQDEGEGDDFLDVLGELAGGSEARCEIRRTSPADYAGYCCTYPLSEMSLDRLQGEWGGGKFNVRVRNARGEFKGSTSVQIAGKPRHRDDSAPAPAPAAAPAPQLDVGAIITAATAGTKSQIELLQGLVTALINKPVPAPPPQTDVLDVIGKLTPLFKQERGGDSADSIKLLMQGIELGKDLAGGGGDDSMLGLAGKGLDMVKTLAVSSAQRRPPGPPQRPPQARPALAPPKIPAPGTVPAAEPEKLEVVDPEAAPMLKLLGWIKQQTQLLCYQAARGKDPQLYADLFLDNIPAGVTLEDIHERMSAPDALQQLAMINPKVAEFPDWMEAFRQAVLASMVDAPEPGESTVIESGPQEPTGDGSGEGS